MLRRGAVALVAVGLIACASDEAETAATTGGGGTASTSASTSSASASSASTSSASTSSTSTSSTSTSSSTGGGVDGDMDGIEDAVEQDVAERYLPFLSIDPDDGCALGGIVYRLSPHPGDATKYLIYYDHLFETDCGLGGHVGDNEVFAITADPAVPPPAGILAVKAISHQATLCEKTSECGGCGLPACPTAPIDGVETPVVFSSKDKHATYVSLNDCATALCFDSCELAPATTAVPLVNAGEPGAHLTNNLTTAGFITAANGWTEPTVMDYDPWGGAEFGGAGVVADDLVDPLFVTTVCP